jgi:uncharacterized protein YbjT (DUF2867 family)
MDQKPLILVTGATGYVAGCLLPVLLSKGYEVRCLVRNPARLQEQSWCSRVEIIQGDVTQPQSLPAAMQGVSTAYYLIHNMSSGAHYIEIERTAAENFGCAARSAGLEHIIYLGGLADPQANISRHLRSRIETGDLLRQCGVPVTEFRASLIIGAGSTSFEMIRYLTEQLPLLIGPRWFHYRTQPVAIHDVLEYLLVALEDSENRGKIYEIGGLEVITYAETMRTYARLRGLERRMLVLPSLPVKFMAAFVHLLTPVPFPIAAPLIGGMQGDSIVQQNLAQQDFPGIQPAGYSRAVQIALAQLTPAHLDLACKKAISPTRRKIKGFFFECDQVQVDATQETIYQNFTNLGGERGWLYLDGLWKLRGWLDRLFGGPGLRGRNDTKELQIGDVIDFYRVEALEPQHMLRLKAELKAPGEGWMEWRVEPGTAGRTSLIQAVYFAPKGLAGFLYWYLLYPFHRLVFRGLIRSMAKKAKLINKSG